jgi:hypothetical protein
MMTEKASRLEQSIRQLTHPINGQYPRPWMTDLEPPDSARVFLIGRNWGVPYSVQAVGSHNRFINAHFNRQGESCQRLYEEITVSRPTRTKIVYEELLRVFAKQGVEDILLTNIICYGTTGSASALRRPEHSGGRERGVEVFRSLLETITPPVLICHGVGTAKDFRRLLKCDLPLPIHTDHDPIAIRAEVSGYRPVIYAIPSLALPGFNRWSSWAPRFFKSLAKSVRHDLCYARDATCAR